MIGLSHFFTSLIYTLPTVDGEHPPFDLGVHVVHEDLPVGSAFLGEGMGTFLLMWTIIMTAVSPTSQAGNMAPAAIGFVVAVANFVLLPWTGSSLNPARSLGPMVVILLSGGGGFRGWWIYYTAPFIG